MVRRLWHMVLTALGVLGLSTAAHASVGYAEASIPVPGAAPIAIAIWYPSVDAATDRTIGTFVQRVAMNGSIKGRRLPLIVISHGSGGSMEEHFDTALALAEAGFVVAALEHPGDNYRDQSRAALITERPAALSRLIDFMLSSWNGKAVIDARRIGAFGFSSGGFTVIAAAGGRPDLSLVGPHCAAHPKYYDCTIVGRSPAGAQLTPIVKDRRLRALVVAAPALGFTFAKGLSDVTVPVELWRADEDQVLPAPDYADAVRAALPKPPRFETVENAGHFDFLAPCSTMLARIAPMICTSRPGFDRAAFHARFSQSIVAFFREHLK